MRSDATSSSRTHSATKRMMDGATNSIATKRAANPEVFEAVTVLWTRTAFIGMWPDWLAPNVQKLNPILICRSRHVDYVADKNGFRAKIRTSEPGTETKNPASVLIDSKPIPVSPMKSQNLPIVQLKTRHEVPTHLTQGTRSNWAVWSRIMYNEMRWNWIAESSHRSTAAQLSVAADEDYLDASNSDQIERAQQMELASLPMDRMQMDYDSNGNHHPQNDLWNVDSNWDESELHRRSEAHVEHYNTFGMRHSARWLLTCLTNFIHLISF